MRFWAEKSIRRRLSFVVLQPKPYYLSTHPSFFTVECVVSLSLSLSLCDRVEITMMMMKTLFSALLLFAAAAALLSLPASSTADGPFIVAHKKATLSRLKSGVQRLSVSIDIYNQGSATAYDVTLNDDSWSQDVFSIIGGNTSTSWERLDSGAHLSHAFELEAKVKSVFSSAPARITFRVPTKAALQEAFSTAIPPLDILADGPPENKFDWAKSLLAKYGSLVSVISIVSLFVYLVATPSSNTAKGSKKKR